MKQKLGKSLDKRPCRARYWITHRLALRKVRNLMLQGLTPALKAWEHWKAKRKGRWVASELTETDLRKLDNKYNQ